MDEQDIFLTALEKESPVERRTWLVEACGTDTRLRQRIESLLARHDDAGSFLERPPTELECTQALADSETHNDKSSDGNFVPLDFLSPSDQAGSLGRIGAYEVQSVLGRGGMGIVLKAHDTRLNRTVAVKVLAPELAANSTARKRFLREAQAAAAIAHPHVVTIHAVDEEKLPYLVMELVDGISLRDKIERDGPLSLSEIFRIGSQIAAGLAAAHKQGLIHRDIKPANILLEQGSQRVKVTDFGLARAVDDLEVTQTGELAGTPQYMSPEQAQGLPLDARSDLFSLGSVLYAMCTGRSPFRAGSAVAGIRRVCDDTPRPIREINPDIPDWLGTIIDRLLAKQPAGRFQTAQEVADLLDQSLAKVHTGQSASPPTTLARPAARLPRELLIATAAAAFFLAALGVWVTIKDKRGQEVARIQVPDGGSVTLETDSQPQAAANVAPAASAAERLAFVLLGGKSVPERKFDSLSDAVLAASDGNTIEIRGNGPFVTDPIGIHSALTIRAASGFRPVIRLSPAGVETRTSLISATAEIAFEGLEFSVAGGTWDYYEPMIIRADLAPLNIANCRLVMHGFRWMTRLDSRAMVRLVNCELIGDRCDLRLDCESERQLEIENCVFAGVGLDIRYDDDCDGGVKVRVARSTFATHPNYGQVGLVFDVDKTDVVQKLKNRSAPAVEIDFSRTVNAYAPRVLFLVLGEQLPKADVLTFLRRFMKWRDDESVYPLSEGFLTYSVQFKKGPNIINDLKEWRQLWGLADSRVIQGNARFQGGDVLAKAATAPEKLTPDDFRLRPDSPGYRAGPDGKDIGADIDLVGPGAAYERFKKTPEYQQWLSEIKQSQSPATDN